MLKKLIIIAFFLTVAAKAEQQDDNVTILNETAQVIKVFKQCSRMSPSFITSYIELDKQLVNKIELMLPSALKKLAPDNAVNLEDYYRQYVSFGQLKRKGVYVNAIHKESAREWAGTDPKRLELLDNWRTTSISICGGDKHWGAIYDDFGNAISEIIFNSAVKSTQ